MDKKFSLSKACSNIRAGFAMLKTKAMMTTAGVSCDDEIEKGDHLLEVLGTIIIAVVILVLFRGVIVNIFTNALSNTQSTVLELFNNATVPSVGGSPG